MLGSSVRAVLVLCGALSAASCGPAPEPRGRLLRVPKVYNALITSDEALLPSRTEQATVGQVLYYPPHHTYPASSGPLILPQVTAQAPPLYHPNQQQYPYQPQQLVSLPPLQQQQQQQVQGEQQQQEQHQEQPLEIYLQPQPPQQGPKDQDDGGAAGPDSVQGLPQPDKTSPVVYAADVQQQQQQLLQQQQQLLQQQQQQLQQQQYAPTAVGEEADADAGQSAHAQPAPFPAARAIQTVEHLAEPGQYEPPPAVHIDSVKNNRPANEAIRDVPPPPLPVGRRGKQAKQAQHEQRVPPGLLPF